MQAWCTSYKTCWCCPQFCTVLRWSLSSACCGINALPMHLIKTLVIFIWLNVSPGGLESLLSLSAINQSISITAAEKRRCIPVYLHFPRPVPQCPTIITISSSPAAIRFRWRVETSHYQQQPGTQSIAMSTTRKLVLSLPRWLLTSPPVSDNTSCQVEPF